MSAHDAAERFARGSGRTIPPPPFRHERPAEQPAPRRRRRVETEEEITPMYTGERQRGATGFAVFVMNALFLLTLLSVLGLLAWWAVDTGRLSTPSTAPQPTMRPTSAPPPTPPSNAGETFGGGGQDRSEPPVVAPEPTATPVWPDDAGGPDLQLPAALPPTADEAAIEAWLAAPPSTPTPLPEPDEPGFVESFQEAPPCSPFIGYLPGDPCIPELTAIAAGK